jgi:hypothetical protein
MLRTRVFPLGTQRNPSLFLRHGKRTAIVLCQGNWSQPQCYHGEPLTSPIWIYLTWILKDREFLLLVICKYWPPEAAREGEKTLKAVESEEDEVVRIEIWKVWSYDSPLLKAITVSASGLKLTDTGPCLKTCVEIMEADTLLKEEQTLWNICVIFLIEV